MPSLVLASASPRRADLLRQIGVPFSTCAVDIDETPLPDELPQDYVSRLALAKAQACLQQLEQPAVVLGSDTTVVCDGHILGKPENEHQAQVMLRRLSASVHQVMTAVAVVAVEQAQVETVITEVRFRSISDDEIHRYWLTGEPCDKAGSYGIQGLGAVFVEQIKGSYSAVVGLPLLETAKLLEEMGIHAWQSTE